MNLNPLDIIIFFILLIFTLSGLFSRFIKTIKITCNLIISIIIANLLLENISNYIPIFSLQDTIFNLFIFILLVVVLSLLIGFLLDFAIYQLENPDLDPNADRILGALVGLVRGFVVTALLIFIFDTTPLTFEMKNKIVDKIETESFFFTPCNNLKDILLD